MSMVAHACYPSYVEGRDGKMEVQGWPQAKSMRPYLKNKLKLKDWKCGSNGRMLVQVPEFKPQYYKN
jgi:hypothetical protein